MWNLLLILISSLTIKTKSDTDIFESDSDHLFNEIEGGSPAEPSDYSYIVSLQLNGNHFCGGTLLRKEYPAAVLTAAHCYRNPNNVLVRLYAKEAVAPFDSRSNNHISFRIEYTSRHPDYNPITFDNDIMILFLEEYGVYGNKRRSLTALSFIETVRIERNQIASANGGNSECCNFADNLQAIGYGNDCFGCDNTPTLEYIDIRYISREACRDWYGSKVSENMNCAADLIDAEKNTCQGDSGGPLIITGTNKQVGVASWGYRCGFRGYPSAYADVGVYYDWIMGHVYLEMDDKESNLMIDDGVTALESLSGNNYWVLLGSLIVFVVAFVGGIWYCYQNGCIFNSYSKDNMYQPISLRENDLV